MNSEAITAIVEYLERHNVNEFAVDHEAEIWDFDLCRIDQRDVLSAWEALQDDPAAPTGAAAIVKHNIEAWGEALWPGQGNQPHAVILSNSIIEALLDLIKCADETGWTLGTTSNHFSAAGLTLGSAQVTLAGWLPKEVQA